MNRYREKTKAIILMLISALAFSVMQIFAKFASAEVHTFELGFFRNLVNFLLVAILVRRQKLHPMEEFKRGGWILLGRSFFGFVGVLLLFYAVGHGPQTDVAMLNHSAPVFVTLCACIFLKERINYVKIGSTILCLVGAYIAMTPSFDSNILPLLCALGAAMSGGVAYTLLVMCKDRVSPNVVVLHLSAFCMIGSGLLMFLFDFVVPSPKTLFMLLMVGVCATIGQVLLTYAYQVVPATEISIYQYTSVVFTAIMSNVFLDEPLTATTVVGGLFILAGTFWVFEYRKRFEA